VGFEVLFAGSLGALWSIGRLVDGDGLGLLFLGCAGIALWRSPGLRSRLIRKLRWQSTRRWFSRVLVSCGVISRHGQIPRDEAVELVPAGQ
jgi:hypothetical protein